MERLRLLSAMFGDPIVKDSKGTYTLRFTQCMSCETLTIIMLLTLDLKTRL